MGADPATGVVDTNCRVYGIDNLYISGSSVFPTAGANFPTITLAALTFRLSEHMVREIRNADAPLAMEAA